MWPDSAIFESPFWQFFMKIWPWYVATLLLLILKISLFKVKLLWLFLGNFVVLFIPTSGHAGGGDETECWAATKTLFLLCPSNQIVNHLTSYHGARAKAQELRIPKRHLRQCDSIWWKLKFGVDVSVSVTAFDETSHFLKNISDRVTLFDENLNLAWMCQSVWQHLMKPPTSWWTSLTVWLY